MGTYAQPGITQGQALMAEKADYASGLSKAIGVAKLSKDNQMAMIETSKNALAKQTAELMQEANKIQSNDNSELADSFKQTIIDQIDALDLLEYNSIGRDQTEVIKMRSNLLNGVEGATGNFMKLLAEAEEYNKRVVNGTSPKTVSNTNSNPESIPFLNALGVNNGRKVKTEWDGLGFNLSYEDPSTGKEFKINPTNYYAGREQGLPGLWNEVQDPSPTFKASYDQLAKKFPNINRVTETTGADGRLTTVASLDSRKAYDNVRNGVLNDKIIKNGINGDTMQFLSGSGYYDKGIGVTYDPENGDQEDELMEAIANYTMDQYSKGSGNQITDIKTKVAKSSGSGSGSGSDSDENNVGKKTAKILQNIVVGINKSPKKSNLNKLIGLKINGKEIASVSEEDGIVTVYQLIDEVQIIDGKQKTIQKSIALTNYDTSDKASSEQFTQKLFQNSGLGGSAKIIEVYEGIPDDMDKPLGDIEDERIREIETTKRVKLSEKLKSSNSVLYKKIPKNKRKEIFEGFSQTEAYKKYQAIKKGKSPRDYRVVEAEYNYQKAQEDYLKNVMKNNNTGVTILKSR